MDNNIFVLQLYGSVSQGQAAAAAASAGKRKKVRQEFRGAATGGLCLCLV